VRRFTAAAANVAANVKCWRRERIYSRSASLCMLPATKPAERGLTLPSDPHGTRPPHRHALQRLRLPSQCAPRPAVGHRWRYGHASGAGGSPNLHRLTWRCAHAAVCPEPFHVSSSCCRRKRVCGFERPSLNAALVMLAVTLLVGTFAGGNIAGGNIAGGNPGGTRLPVVASRSAGEEFHGCTGGARTPGQAKPRSTAPRMHAGRLYKQAPRRSKKRGSRTIQLFPTAKRLSGPFTFVRH
jgi:hypothetical protein